MVLVVELPQCSPYAIGCNQDFWVTASTRCNRRERVVRPAQPAEPEPNNPEIGRELTISDLKPETVVVIKPPGKNVSITMWIEAVGPNTVTFFSGTLGWHVINFIRDGQIFDDQNRVVQVFEYLGEV